MVRIKSVPYVIILAQQHTTLTVSHQSPSDLGILELLNTQLTSKRAIGLVIDVLGGHADGRVGQLADKRKVQGGRRHDDFGGRVALGFVQVFDDGFDGVGDSVPSNSKMDGELCVLMLLEVSMEGEDAG